MTTGLRKRIRNAISDEMLQSALDANAERRVHGRANAIASLPDWNERRRTAHAIREDVIEHLDEYLVQFTGNAQKNGINVHHAKNAREAVNIVLQIASQLEKHPDKTLIVKSKSMVSEEIELNHALEVRDFQVVETDLGEFIVQLRNEKPAHIITPAIHLTRKDVGALFEKKFGVPYTEDIPTLTAIARKTLREKFLEADIGVSGVNFGIAGTGGICIVTNEGNGRMVTSLPPIHIALMGMERMVRNFDDLSLMLSLLPRSATGQKLTVYTQLIHQPLDGQQRHIILLDNGRSRLRNSSLKESLYCIRCGACLNACPVFREIGGHGYKSPYSGPIGSVISSGLFGSEFIPLAQASTLCGACKDACPVDIDLPNLLMRVRADQSPTQDLPTAPSGSRHGLSWMSRVFLQIYSRIIPHPTLFKLLQKFAWLGSNLISPINRYIRVPAFTGWGYSKDLQKFERETFREKFSSIHQKVLTPAKENIEHVEIEEKHTATIESDQAKRFIEEVEKVGGQVVRTSQQDLANNIINVLKAETVNQIHLEENVLDEELFQKEGISISHTRDPRIRVGVTKAICGLADTGSVLEANDSGDKLFASLLPEIHLAILHEKDLYPSLENAMRFILGTKSAVFITGPSRTADIEMSHTIGVHGPGRVVVFLTA